MNNSDLRKFNEDGQLQFKKLYLDIQKSVKDNGWDKGYWNENLDFRSQMKNLVNDNKLTVILPQQVELEHKNFKSGFEFGKYLSSTLRHEYGTADLIYDNFIWDWITAYYFEYLIKPQGSNSKTSGKHRYILHKDYAHTWRHLVRNSWYTVNWFGEYAELYLYKEMHNHSNSIEQLLKYRIHHKVRWSCEAYYKLYWDKEKKAMLPGLDREKPEGSSRIIPGSIVRFRKLLESFNKIYDLGRINADFFIENLLTKEFDDIKKTQGLI